MTLEQQVCSLESAKKLKSLNVRQESIFFWCDIKGVQAIEFVNKGWHTFKGDVSFSAFTVAELGEGLPQIIKIKKLKYQLFCSVAMDKQWFVVYVNEEDYEDNAPFPIIMHHNEAEARAKMLIYLLENGLIPPIR